MRNNFLVANWENLVVATFETEKKTLQPFLPPGTELNDWNGKICMSLVGFMFTNTSLFGIPSPFYRSFEELNLRFYVRRREGNLWKKGVVFIKEIVPARLIGWMGKLLYRENFISLPMHHAIYTGNNSQVVEYYWKVNKQTNFLKIRSSLLPAISNMHTLDHFISEHYTAFNRKGADRTISFNIEHRPWKVYPALTFDMRIDARLLYGDTFAEAFTNKPLGVFLMDGSRTTVSAPRLQ
jgi:uncharacterized protein